MVGLLDIAPPTRTVDVGGASLSVTGVSAQGIAYLIGRFPEVRDMMGGGKDPDAKIEFSPERIMSLVPDAIAAVIAAGCGYPNNEEAEKKAASLPAEYQLDLITAIVELTMPKGAGPFFEKLNDVMANVGDLSVKVPPMASEQPLSN